MRRHDVNLRLAQFLAVLMTALALIPAGAHLFELPNKIDLPRDAYLTVQGIYAGWAWFGIVDLGALIMNVVLAIRLRRQRRAFSFAVTAALCFVVFFAIFFTWTFPANQATANWTSMPDNWSELRQEWEYSHAVNAIVMLVALCSVTLSVITAKQDRISSRA
jgi:cytochrome bd-type quinol oxidase subunit 2